MGNWLNGFVRVMADRRRSVPGADVVTPDRSRRMATAGRTRPTTDGVIPGRISLLGSTGFCVPRQVRLFRRRVWVRAEAAILLASRDARLLRKTLAAELATLAEVCSFIAMGIHHLLILPRFARLLSG